MARLFLVRPGPPPVDPSTTDAAAGAATGPRVPGVARLADRLAGTGIAAVVTSVDPEALTTARELAAQLDLDMHSAGGLEAPSADETVGTAVDRFGEGLDAVLGVHRGQSIAVVAEGRVMSGWLARTCGVDAEVTEQTLGRPSYVVVDVDARAVVDVVPSL
jgi:broad specificity phosphatase PhoE